MREDSIKTNTEQTVRRKQWAKSGKGKMTSCFGRNLGSTSDKLHSLFYSTTFLTMKVHILHNFVYISTFLTIKFHERKFFPFQSFAFPVLYCGRKDKSRREVEAEDEEKEEDSLMKKG